MPHDQHRPPLLLAAAVRQWQQDSGALSALPAAPVDRSEHVPRRTRWQRAAHRLLRLAGRRRVEPAPTGGSSAWSAPRAVARGHGG